MSIEVRQSVMTALRLLKSNYRHAGKPIDLDQDVIHLWHVALAHVTDFGIQEALKQILVQKKDSFFPSTGEFLSYIQESAEDEASEAWANLIEAIKQHGTYCNMDFENTFTAEWIRRHGGWMDLCSKTYEDLHWLKKEFVDEYQGLKKSGKQFLEHVPGFHKDFETSFVPAGLLREGDSEQILIEHQGQSDAKKAEKENHSLTDEQAKTALASIIAKLKESKAKEALCN